MRRRRPRAGAARPDEPRRTTDARAAAARPDEPRRTPDIRAAAIAAPPVAAGHPTMIAAALIAATIAGIAVTVRIYEYDFWEHLLVGRAIFAMHSVPTRQIWTWPTFGAPDVNPSWGFSLILWPFWLAGGWWGLSLWRLGSTLAALGLLWAAARRMGARGFTAFLVLVLCALAYRQRAQMRPETLASLLMALQIWVLERRRHRPPGEGEPLADGIWLVAIAWAWANAHLSYYLGFVWIGLHLLDDLLARRRGTVSRSPARLFAAMAAAAAISFMNPFGWRALWEPFRYVFEYRNDLLYSTIAELAPLSWTRNLLTGIPLLLVAWPLLALWRWRRAGPDVVELLACAIFTAHVIHAQRFVGFYAIAAGAYLARDLDLLVSTRRWPLWSRPAGARAALAVAGCVLLALPDLSADTPGVGPIGSRYPVRACDVIQSRGIRGRGFNPFYYGGYLLWRFWPERDRLPFMDVHAAGTPHDRELMARAAQPAAWAELDGHYRFEYVLARRSEPANASLLDLLDSRPEWALVFVDDVAAVYVRRDGRNAAVAEREAYRLQPAGTARLSRLGAAMEADTALRRAVDAELAREIRDSPWHAVASSRRARLALFEGRLGDARRWTEEALRITPLLTGEHERLGAIALAQGRPADALAEFRRERRFSPDAPRLDFEMGQAWRRLGDVTRARAAYRRAAGRDSTDRAARDSLAALDGR